MANLLDYILSLEEQVTNSLKKVGINTASIKKTVEADMQKANMVTLFKGNEQAAKNMYDKIASYGKITPYEKSDLLDVQRTMMGFGVEAQKSFGVIKQIGDIAMGDKDKMKELALAYSKATSAGKLHGDSLSEMISAGFNPLQVISERTGQSMTSLQQKMENGQIDAKALANAFEMATDKQGQFYKGAENADATIGGKLANLMEGINDIQQSIFNALAPILIPLIEVGSKVVDKIGKGIAWLLGKFNEGAPIIDKIRTGIAWLVNKFNEGNPVILGIAAALGVFATALLLYNGYMAISKVLQANFTLEVWKTNLAFLSNPVFGIILAIVVLIAIITYLIYVFDGWGAAWGHLMDFFSYSWEAFKSSFLIIWLTVKDEFLSGIEVLQKAWYQLKSLWDEDGAKAGLAKIENQQNERAAEILKAKNQLRDEAEKALVAGSKIFSKEGLHGNGKALADLKNDIMSKLGITPNAPSAKVGTNNSNGGITTKITNEAVATGGTKNNTITINIGKQIEKFTMMVNNAQEGAEKLREIILDEMTRAIAMSQSITQ